MSFEIRKNKEFQKSYNSKEQLDVSWIKLAYLTQFYGMLETRN